MKKITRRKLMKNSLFTLALGTAIDSYLRSYFFTSGNAYASISDASDKYYIGLQFHGGPARWNFDLPLYKR